MIKKRRLAFITPEKTTGWENKSGKAIKDLKKHHYLIEEGLGIGGDAPKEVVRVYEYGYSVKSKPKTWVKYIAKSSRKWYPNECITEHLLSKLGIIFGLNMAESKVLRVRGQVRYFSKYFLNKDEELIHGADIYVGYMEDQEFVKEVEEQGKEGEIFTVEVTRKALVQLFGHENGERIFKDYCWMLIFDAWVGNNDRHFYNWGVVKSLKKTKSLVFSPVYDTARGLLWNNAESDLEKWCINKTERSRAIKKYCNKSKPKTGISGAERLNHYKFIQQLCQLNIPISKTDIQEKLTSKLLEDAEVMINQEFALLLSPNRNQMIVSILKERAEQILQHIQ